MLTNGDFNEQMFRHQVDSALSRVKTILDTTRTPTYAADEEHTYGDKYALAELLTNIAMAAQINVLERLGMDDEALHKLHSFVANDKSSVTLRFTASETCEFLKEEEVEVQSKHHGFTEIEETETVSEKDEENTKKKITTTYHKVTTKVTEYHWKVCMNYDLYAFAGSDPECAGKKVILRSRRPGSASRTLVTVGVKKSPFPSRKNHDPIDLSLTWLLQNISGDSFKCNFKIHRLAESCRTPRRNKEISSAIRFFNNATKSWSEQVESYFWRVSTMIDAPRNEGQNHPPTPRRDLRQISNDHDIFVPVLPLFEKPKGAEETKDMDNNNNTNMIVSLPPRDEESTSPLLPIEDINLFLNEQCRSLDSALTSLSKSFQPEQGEQVLISSLEASLVLLSKHMWSISQHFCDGVNYIEDMLRSQLISAIGKEIQASDFEEFIRFHNKKLFKEEFVPRPFCHAIRRPKHFPDGVLSIESTLNSSRGQRGGETAATPVTTFVRKIKDSTPFFFPINAATSVEFVGETFLHAWVCQQFGEKTVETNAFQLVARARQFSSFLLLIGKISGPNSFEPTHAMILQNKDEVMIPLLLDQLPTPKEFKDAIKSLSPEQQRFAKAFRSMQLESSVFGVCAVQLKPQLEVLLGLPHNSLTKEVRLTQDLLTLFIDYQISSDLLSFDGDMSMSVSEKVNVVKGHVAAVREMIEEMKKKELQQAEKEADMDFELGKRFMYCDYSRERDDGGRRGRGGEERSVSRRSYLVKQSVRAQMRNLESRAASNTAPLKASRLSRSSDVPQESTFQGASPDKTLIKRQKDPKDTKERNVQNLSEVTEKDKHVDFTLIPKQLDAKFEVLDEDSSLRPTIIKTGPVWNKKMQQNLLTKMTNKKLRASDQRNEKNKAFDLLDALSRSGSLPIACAELHVFVAATHVFEHSLIDTVIQDNVNPIEKMERSLLIITSTIYDMPPAALLKNKTEENRLLIYSPNLFIDDFPGPPSPNTSSQGSGSKENVKPNKYNWTTTSPTLTAGSRTALELAIEAGDWEAVGEAAAMMSDASATTMSTRDE